MKIRTLGRHVREGVKNLGRNGWMTVASALSVTITLLILGIFLLLAMNVNSFAQEIEDQVEIRVFLDLESGEEEIAAVEQGLEALSGVRAITYVPKDEGIENFISSMGEQGQHFEEFKDDNNPLPDVFVVQAIDPHGTEQLAQQIEQFDHVYRVNYGAGTVERLFAVTNTVRNIGLIFIIGLAFTAMLLIANTIKITIVARSREIEIMKLVGATNMFIRWPFFIEGLLLGIMGSIIPIAILLVGYQQLLEAVGQTLEIHFFALLPIYPLAYQISGLLLGIGAFIGIWGSITSVRRFLRI
ncbi:permease-like cell division protein FtsX [Bacillus horti]|uniref:Cell division protein FtsX n=1 Tax=Caldalkalibacillus horti TaxID=77523 RepID=A0ABT9VZ99_9BACI|nr:permease-like cell division protein FtsX [Bacillus horti]MDQ0166316.1 cell division transport system permease protein [Bacillus horti]